MANTIAANNLQDRIQGLSKLGDFLSDFLFKTEENFSDKDRELNSVILRSKDENSWFTEENQKHALGAWAKELTLENLENWMSRYSLKDEPKKVGLILAGNIPLVGLHDVISVILTGNIPLIKLSSKDRRLIPFLLNLWNELSGGKVEYELVERLEGFDAVIATGSNNTASYLNHYFSKYPSIIRKNRTSVGVLLGEESEEEIKSLGEDIFQYFGLGCRNVTHLFLPKDFSLDRLFENFIGWQEIINHHSYANNYDYHKAIYLLNQDQFWDNNFVMIKEEKNLFSPLSTIHFTRYSSIEEVDAFLDNEKQDIQCVVSKHKFDNNTVGLGEAQCPKLWTYADHVDTVEFLTSL